VPLSETIRVRVCIAVVNLGARSLYAPISLIDDRVSSIVGPCPVAAFCDAVAR